MRLHILLICFFVLFLTDLTADWYRSDALGRPGGLLAAGTDPNEILKEKEEYLLYREESPESLTEELYSYGGLVRKRSVRQLSGGRREEIVLEGPERRVTLYDAALPLREEIYQGEALQRIMVYGWEGSRLDYIEVSSGEELLYRQEYILDPLGRLRTIVRYMVADRDTEGSSVKVIQYGYREGSLAETWVGDYNDGVRTRFDGMQALEETRMSGTSVVGRIERETFGDTQVERSYDVDGELVSTTIRGSEGRTLREILHLDGGRVREKEYRYRESLLIEMVIREPERLERRVYSYQDNTLRKEEIFVNRRLVKVSSFEGDQKLEEFYRRGEVITRRRYEKDILISEERYE
jgi:hypothetical protein